MNDKPTASDKIFASILGLLMEAFLATILILIWDYSFFEIKILLTIIFAFVVWFLALVIHLKKQDNNEHR